MHHGERHNATHQRHPVPADAGTWFGFEQEYFVYKDGRPLGFPAAGYPAPQGPYYTGVGYSNVGNVARKLVEEHLEACLAAGLKPDLRTTLAVAPDVGMPAFLAIEHHHLEHVARFLVQGRHRLDLIRGRSPPIAIFTVDPTLALPTRRRHVPPRYLAEQAGRAHG